MRAAAAGALIALFVVACGDTTTGSVTTSSPTTTTPATTPMATRWSCGDTHNGATALALYRVATTSPSVQMVDASNPLKPYLACTLAPAYGARSLSMTKVAFWIGDQLGMADLRSGAITQTARLAATATQGAFSADGTKFAYRHYGDSDGFSTHLYANGSDRTLYVQEPIGGHGGPGPSFGFFDQLAFSPDGSLLLDFNTFRPSTGPATLLVFRADGSIAFQASSAPGAIWSATGSTLYFYVPNQSGTAGELDRLQANGRRDVVANGLQGMYWARMSPDGRSIVYNASDSSVPDCGGVPHLWSLDLSTGRATQISSLISSSPYFVKPTVLWSDEQKLSQCGPGGPSSEDGVILAHDLSTGKDAPVDTSLVPTDVAGSLLTWNLLDVWFAPA